MNRFIIAVMLFAGMANAITMALNGGEKQCIWEEGGIGDQLFASYEVTKGDFNSLEVSVYVVVYL